MTQLWWDHLRLCHIPAWLSKYINSIIPNASWNIAVNTETDIAAKLLGGDLLLLFDHCSPYVYTLNCAASTIIRKAISCFCLLFCQNIFCIKITKSFEHMLQLFLFSIKYILMFLNINVNFNYIFFQNSNFCYLKYTKKEFLSWHVDCVPFAIACFQNCSCSWQE